MQKKKQKWLVLSLTCAMTLGTVIGPTNMEAKATPAKETEKTEQKVSVMQALQPGLNESSIVVYPGDQYQLSYTEKEGETNYPKWTSLNTDVAFVDSEGRVTALKEGQTFVILELNGKSYSCFVTVLQKNNQTPSTSQTTVQSETTRQLDTTAQPGTIRQPDTTVQPQPTSQIFSKPDTDIPDGYTPIRTIDDLFAINNNPSGNYILMNDIDLTEATATGGSWDTGNGWTPLSTFSGTLDGNGCRIIGMHIYGNNLKYVGLFSKLDKTAVVKNLGMINVNIETNYGSGGYSKSSIGVLAGDTSSDDYDTNGAVVFGVYVSGKINASADYIAGLCGASDYWYPAAICANCINMIEIVNNYFGGTSCGIGFGDCYNCVNLGKVQENPVDNKSNRSKDNYYLDTSCDNVTNRTGVTSRKDAQLKSKVTYTGFDFENVWMIDPYSTFHYAQLRSNPVVRVNKLELISKPDKLTYNQGENLNLSGAVVKISYEDGYDQTVAVSKDMLGSYDMSKLGAQTIKVQVLNKTVEFGIDIQGIPVDSVTLSDSSMVVDKTKTKKLNASVLPQNATYKTVTWSSSDDKIATVDATGLVTGKSAGKATITAKSANGVEAKCEVTVMVPCASIQFEDDDYDMMNGETKELTITMSPLDCNKQVQWSSSDPSIVTVDQEGRIHAVNLGTAKITATASSGTSESCEVTVYESLEGYTITGLTNKTYTGYYIRPDIQVVKNGKALKNGTDYEVSYQNNYYVGTATVVVSGCGYYIGKLKAEFQIEYQRYTVAFVSNGKTVSTQSVKIGNNANADGIVVPGRKGYVFAGWDKSFQDIESNLVVNAVWLNVKPKKPIVYLGRFKRGICVIYSRLENVKGYEIRYSRNSNMSNAKTIKTGATRKNIKKLKRKKKYYIQVRGYTIDSTGGKAYGKWSKKRKATII